MKSNTGQAPQTATTIAVKYLKFARAIDLPGKEATEAVTAGGPKNGTNFEIEYLPAMRHHRIICNRPGEKARLVYMHESQVYLWEPLL